MAIETHSPLKKTRSNLQLTFDNKLCVFCQQRSVRMNNCSLTSFSTGKAAANISKLLDHSGDKIIRGRLLNVDLVAAEVKYHKSCYSQFTRKCSIPLSCNKTNDLQDVRCPLSLIYTQMKPDLMNGKVFLAGDVVKQYREITSDNSRREFSILRSFSTKYESEIMLIEVGKEEKLIISRAISISGIINAAFQQKKKVMSECIGSDEDLTVKAAADIIARDIKSSWKPIDNFDLNAEKIQSIIPSTLQMFLDKIGSDRAAKRSIAQDLVYLVTRKTPPKHITLANYVQHKTGSRLVIDQLNEMGHCCSYTQLLRVNTGIALSELNAAQDLGVIIPPNILPASLGFIQAAADNDDFQEDTRDGKNTTHGTTMVLFQRQGIQNGSFARPMLKTRKRSLHSVDYKELVELKKIQTSKQKASPPSFQYSRAAREFSDISNLLKFSSGLANAALLDLEWVMARLMPTKLYELNIRTLSQKCPSWSSYNARKHPTVASNLSVVGYCPMLNHPSTDPSTIYTVLVYLKTIMEKLGQPHSVITFDLALYKIAKDIQWSRPSEFENTVVRMGGFHIMKNYLAALGTMLDTSGLRQLLIEAGLYSNVTINQIFAGKHYNRAIRTHKLVFEALMRKKTLAVGQWMFSKEMSDPLDGISDDQPCAEKMAEAISSALERFQESQTEEATIAKFWDSYLHAVQVLLCFLRAERVGDWQLYLDSMIAMLPVMFAFDRINYARWLPVYIYDMLNLPDTALPVYEQFKDGAFSVNRTGKSFAGVSTDQVLEQTLNKDSKTAGGLIGISSDEEARTKWFLTTHLRAHLLSVQRQVYSTNTAISGSRHKEDTDRTTLRDEVDIQALLNTLEKYEANLFAGNDRELINLASGVKPSADASLKIVSALKMGSEKAKAFITERLHDESTPFHATLSKLKIPSFEHLPPTKCKKKTSVKGKRIPFAKLLILTKSRSIDITQILKHELGPIPLSIFDENGDMRKTQKSLLVKALEDQYLEETHSAIDRCNYGTVGNTKALVIDAMSIIQTNKGIGTFRDYSEKLLDIILRQGLGFQRIDVVFDVYDKGSIKSVERERRGAQKMCSIKIQHDMVQIPKNWSDFLSNVGNKNELVKYLSKSWSQKLDVLPPGVSLYVSETKVHKLTNDNVIEYQILNSNHDEADTRLILHAADALKHHDLAVIRSVDTDVVVLAIHHFKDIVARDNTEKDLIMSVGMANNQRYISVAQLTAQMPANVVKNVLPLHALTGCDSTSSLFRISKKKALAVMSSEEFDLAEFGGCEWEPLDTETINEAERFIAHLYGEFDDVSAARYRLLATKTLSSEAQLPPSKNSLTYHIRRAAFQVSLWKMSLIPMISSESPKDHGWNEELKPIMCDESPNTQLMLTSCKCSKSKCAGRACKCRKNGMKCSDLCLCEGCENEKEGCDDEEHLTDSEDSSEDEC